jgi:hypothetical protein
MKRCLREIRYARVALLHGLTIAHVSRRPVFLFISEDIRT